MTDSPRDFLLDYFNNSTAFSVASARSKLLDDEEIKKSLCEDTGIHAQDLKEKTDSKQLLVAIGKKLNTGTFVQNLNVQGNERLREICTTLFAISKATEKSTITNLFSRTTADSAFKSATKAIVYLNITTNVGVSNITVTWTYTDAQLEAAGVAAEDLVFYVWNADTSEWEEIDTTVDTTTKTISSQPME